MLSNKEKYCIGNSKYFHYNSN